MTVGVILQKVLLIKSMFLATTTTAKFMLIRTLFCLLLQRILGIVLAQMMDETAVLECYIIGFECEMISFYES
jgi:hypothetical protein